MSGDMTQPNYVDRVRRIEREVHTYRGDIEAWKKVHQRLEKCWAWEDLVSKANYLYDRVLELDTDFQDLLVKYHDYYDAGLDDQIRQLAHEWLALSGELIDGSANSHEEFGVDGFKALESNFKSMTNMLSDDNHFFDPAHLCKMEENAIESHRRGKTEPLEKLFDEPAQRA